jgi:hypothetical protein
MKVTLLLSTSGFDESAGTPESVQLLLVGVFGEAISSFPIMSWVHGLRFQAHNGQLDLRELR